MVDPMSGTTHHIRRLQPSGAMHARFRALLPVVFCCALAASNVLRADGIALSQDGMTWLAGTGGYGKGWGDVGHGITVEAGSTVYIKYYSQKRAPRGLFFAPHGTKWGEWSHTGPVIPVGVGERAESPVVLKFEHVGTTKGTVTWVNGKGSWAGINATGVYDLALQQDAMWTLPPLVIIRKEPWWKALWPFGGSHASAGADPVSYAVPDHSSTGFLLAISLACLAIFRRGRRAGS
jgi:hypothetical protein